MGNGFLHSTAHDQHFHSFLPSSEELHASSCSLGKVISEDWKKTSSGSSHFTSKNKQRQIITFKTNITKTISWACTLTFKKHTCLAQFIKKRKTKMHILQLQKGSDSLQMHVSIL